MAKPAAASAESAQDISQTSLLLPFLVADDKKVRQEALTAMLGLSGSEDGRIELVATDAPKVCSHDERSATCTEIALCCSNSV